MARFTVAARRALDPALPVHARFLALLWAIDSYCALTGESFHGTYERVGRAFEFDWNDKPSDGQIETAVALLGLERHSFLLALSTFAAERKEEKRTRRQRQPSSSQLRHLYFAAWFEAPGVHLKTSPALQRLRDPVV
jgi:hypothetical protein